VKGSASGLHRYSEGGNTMKSVHEALDQILPEIIAMSEDIYCHPELGFKEFRTRSRHSTRRGFRMKMSHTRESGQS